MSPSSKLNRVRFGAFVADLHSFELFKHGIRLKLQNQPFQILKLLLARPGELVTREELRVELWTESTFVDFNAGLNAAIRRLRDALNDAAEEPRYIETLPRHGYRFIAEVEELPDPETMETRQRPVAKIPLLPGPVEETASLGVREETNLARPAAPITTRSVRRFLLPVLAATAFLFLVVMLNSEPWRRHFFISHASPRIQSIAVLPLQNLSGDPAQDYFADGITDALITDLARISSLNVISRNSMIHYKGTKKTIPEIARELNVDAIIEGSVIQADGRVRITAQLLQAAPEKHLWAESYDRDLRDVLPLQSQVAQAIAVQVRATVTPEESLQLAKATKPNPEAYEAFLMGHYFVSGGDPDGDSKGIPYLRRAIELDPSFVAPYTELAGIYCFVGELPEGREGTRKLIMKALEIDPDSAEGHTMLGCLYLRHDWDFVRGEAEFRKAVNLEPGSSVAHEWLGTYLWNTNQLEEASAELQKARRLDPLSLKINGTIGLILYSQHRYDDAVKQFNKTLEMDPRFSMAHRHLLRVYDQVGDIPNALEEYVAAAPWQGITSEQAIEEVRILQKTYKSSGNVGYWKKRVELEEQRAARKTPDPTKRASFALAELHARLGHKDRAIVLLDRLYDQRMDGLLIWLKCNPAFDSLRDDLRFQDLVRRVGFPPDPPNSKPS
jgi:TolB-like protein/DNA-binding winged helix-turn-helix (wHTH) protein